MPTAHDNLLDDNILVSGLRPMLSREDATAALTYLPPLPRDVGQMEKKYRILHLMALKELHLPSPEEIRLFDTVDLLTMDSLRIQNPSPAKWASATREYGHRPLPAAYSAAVGGHSGTGKSASMLHILHTQKQTVVHPSFPMAARPVVQIVWLSIQVPASGLAADVAAALMRETDRVAGTDRFSATLSRGLSKIRGMALLQEWEDAIKGTFLAIVHFDEIQNLFKLNTLAKRRSKSTQDDTHHLAVVEDKCLRWYLNFMNGPVATISSGTPDGIAALTSRFATTQRFVSGGYHRFNPFEKVEEPYYQQFIRTLWEYQYVATPLPYSDALAALILELSGGIMRIIIALWFAAHRVALARKNDLLKESDFRKAASTYLAPLQPAIEAIRSRDPQKYRQFSDMLNGDHEFWAAFWQLN